jgi:hypothetical protein
MTTLNATPATIASPPGTGTPPVANRAIPDPMVRKAASKHDDAVSLHLPGSGGTTSAATDAAQGMVALGTARNQVVVPLDAFSKQAGPDVSVKTEGGIVSAHAVFQMDARTRELTVAVVDQDGNLLRLIPPDSVARMITAMAAYRGR